MGRIEEIIIRQNELALTRAQSTRRVAWLHLEIAKACQFLCFEVKFRDQELRTKARETYLLALMYNPRSLFARNAYAEFCLLLKDAETALTYLEPIKNPDCIYGGYEEGVFTPPEERLAWRPGQCTVEYQEHCRLGYRAVALALNGQDPAAAQALRKAYGAEFAKIIPEPDLHPWGLIMAYHLEFDHSTLSEVIRGLKNFERVDPSQLALIRARYLKG